LPPSAVELLAAGTSDNIDAPAGLFSSRLGDGAPARGAQRIAGARAAQIIGQRQVVHAPRRNHAADAQSNKRQCVLASLRLLQVG